MYNPLINKLLTLPILIIIPVILLIVGGGLLLIKNQQVQKTEVKVTSTPTQTLTPTVLPSSTPSPTVNIKKKPLSTPTPTLKLTSSVTPTPSQNSDVTNLQNELKKTQDELNALKQASEKNEACTKANELSQIPGDISLRADGESGGNGCSSSRVGYLPSSTQGVLDYLHGLILHFQEKNSWTWLHSPEVCKYDTEKAIPILEQRLTEYQKQKALCGN